MKLYDFQSRVDDNSDLTSYAEFADFTKRFLEFIDAGRTKHPNIQAEIISRKETNYRFIQYKDDGHYCVTRPINSDIFISADEFDAVSHEFEAIIRDPQSIVDDHVRREYINRVVYTCQQCVGCTLDSFNNPNKARKRNGLLFEILIRDIVRQCGVDCDSLDEKVEVSDDETMKFQHDLVLKNANDEIAGIGQLKTSSKDRIDKIFLDKYMYSKLTGTDIPHFVVFLNDVQRASNKDGNYYVSSTFLPGHFKTYTLALIPLDGVYYFDIRPNMETDEDLVPYIHKFDKFLVEDMWNML